MAKAIKEPAIGIDLGTTYSCVSVIEHGKKTVIADEKGRRITPSYVAFTEDGHLVGHEAKDQMTRNPENTVYEVKRIIGRKMRNPEVAKDIKDWPFQVLNAGGRPKIKVTHNRVVKRKFPEEISALVLGKMKKIAEAYLKKTITEAVITVPAYFNDSQRQATKDAGDIAGLKVLRIISEPTAAALAYGLEQRHSGEKNIIVYDLGGGTFDVSVLGLDGGIFEVKATSGNTHLGGKDFDKALIQYFVGEFEREQGASVTSNKRAMARLKAACETLKHSLSSRTEDTIVVDSFHNGIDFTSTITRTKFEELNKDFFNTTMDHVRDAIKEAKLNKNKIDEVILVGGSTRIPKIREMVKEFFQGKSVNASINPDETVALGAGVMAAMLSGSTFEELDEMLLLDVMPLSLGIEAKGDVMSTITKRNRTIPTRQSKPFTTTVDNQETIPIKVLEGERVMAEDNNTLGQFKLNNLPRRPRGEVHVTVTFDIDADGILNVTAEEASTQMSGSITIQNDKGRLSKEEIRDIIRDSEQYRMEDDRRMAGITAMNDLDLILYKMKAAIQNQKYSTHITKVNKKKMLNKCDKVTKWMADHQNARKEEYQRQQKELCEMYKSIIGPLQFEESWQNNDDRLGSYRSMNSARGSRLTRDPRAEID